MQRPALLLFDLDGVLVHYDRAARVRVLAERIGLPPAAVAQALFGSGLEDFADRGEIDSRGHVAILAEVLGVPVTREDCVRARAAAMRADAALLDLAARAAGHCRVGIFSNNGWLLREELPAMCPALFPLFEDGLRCSAEFGLCKPDPEAFRRCVESLAAEPAQTLFIDDNAGNVQGAVHAGLRGHHYRGLPGLRAELHSLDLPEPDHAP